MNKNRAPVFFVGHGSPMNALADNEFTRAIARMRDLCLSPKAVLCVSAHWTTKGTRISRSRNPRTIHDFYGFPAELFAMNYPAPGDPELAAEMANAISGLTTDDSWGIDHGAWSVLCHMFPKAEVPVLQLSLDLDQPPAYHFQFAQALRSWRERGVLILGSGNIVHNLGLLERRSDASPYPWAEAFDLQVKEKLVARQFTELLDFTSTPEAKLSVPTPEHYLPMLYVLGAADPEDELHFSFEGSEHGSISLRSFVLG